MEPAAAHADVRCEKVMSNVDLQKLSVPTRIRGHVWRSDDPHGKVRFFGVVDGNGNHWSLRGRLRIDPRGHRKPEVSGDGWRRLVRDKGLRRLDKIVFYKNPNGDFPLFRVSVSKRLPPVIKLFGKDIQNPNEYGMEE